MSEKIVLENKKTCYYQNKGLNCEYLYNEYKIDKAFICFFSKIKRKRFFYESIVQNFSYF